MSVRQRREERAMSRHTTVEIVEQNDAAVGTDTDGTTVEEQFETTGIRPSVPRDPPPHDTVDRCFGQLKRLLREVPRGFPAKTCTIFRIPKLLRGINPKAEEPEIVSIGPYHRDKPQVLEFERLKPLFLKRFLRRTKEDLKELTALVAKMESSARACYSEHVNMTSCDFVQMMLLDGCFVAEFLLHISGSGAATDEHDPIFARPQIIPILIRDLLKLENQIPYSVLEFLSLSHRRAHRRFAQPLAKLGLTCGQAGLVRASLGHRRASPGRARLGPAKAWRTRHGLTRGPAMLR